MSCTERSRSTVLPQNFPIHPCGSSGRRSPWAITTNSSSKRYSGSGRRRWRGSRRKASSEGGMTGPAPVLLKNREGEGEMNWFEWIERETRPGEAEKRRGAFDGLLVLDLSYGNLAGSVCSSFLAEQGARVIRVELPGGDISRKFTPEGTFLGDSGLGYLVEELGKESVVLDYLSPEGGALLKKMASQADVLIETHGQEKMVSVGLGYPELSGVNGRLIYLSITPTGNFGPDSAPGEVEADVVGQARSGIIYLTGEPEEEGKSPEYYQVPTRVGSWFSWYAGGIFGAFSVAGALFYRESSGKGQFIDLTPSESILQFLDYNLTWYHAAGRVRERLGNFDIAVYPYTFVRCKDGYTFIAAYNDDAFRTLCEIMGKVELLDDPRFASFSERTKLENERELVKHIEEWTSRHTADEILRIIQDTISRKSGPGAAVVTGRVNRPDETLKETHWWERGVFVNHEDPDYGRLVLQGPGYKMTETPPRVRREKRPLGADTVRVLKELCGLADEELERLKRKGIISS
ncbi:MAG: CoA transferase [Deltaproteobacteria bacterium]|nr:MAG: CoA transferase [Deltaproteobacteria bacterium]